MVKKRTERKKRSVIWKIPLSELKEKVGTYDSFGRILKDYGLENKGGNSATLKRRLLQENLDFRHIPMGIDSNGGRNFGDRRRMTLQECMDNVFVKKSLFDRRTIKRYIFNFNLLPHVCGDCKLENIWNGKPLVLQLDHINGVSDDNCISNLCWRCPNCHSQTETFAGRNNR